MTVLGRIGSVGVRKLGVSAAALAAAGLAVGLNIAPASASTASTASKVVATGQIYNYALSPRCLGNTGNHVYMAADSVCDTKNPHTIWREWDNGSRGHGFQNVASGNCLNVIPGSPATVNAIKCNANDALQNWGLKQYIPPVNTVPVVTFANRGTAQPKCLNANGHGGDVNALLCDGKNTYMLWTTP
jgi:hypothetical protein